MSQHYVLLAKVKQYNISTDPITLNSVPLNKEHAYPT